MVCGGNRLTENPSVRKGHTEGSRSRGHAGSETRISTEANWYQGPI